jgi:hypothetical protein
MSIAILKGLLLLAVVAVVLRPDKANHRRESAIRRRYRQSRPVTIAKKKGFVMPHQKVSPWSEK